ncbi:MAG: hypothetical protein ACRDY7_15485, partial [Acidimicrobiia bacterium]
AELCVDLEQEGQSAPAGIFAVDDLAVLRNQLTDAGYGMMDEGEGWIQVGDPDGNILVCEQA